MKKQFTIRHFTGKPFGVFDSVAEANKYLESHILDNPSAYGLLETDLHDFYFADADDRETTFDLRDEISKLHGSVYKGCLALERYGDWAVSVTEECVIGLPTFEESVDRKLVHDGIQFNRVLRIWHFNRFFHKWCSKIEKDSDYDRFVEVGKELGRKSSWRGKL